MRESPDVVRRMARGYFELTPGEAEERALRAAAGRLTARSRRVVRNHLRRVCGPCCLRCRLPYSGRWGPRPLTIDHVVPVVLGGSSHTANLQPLCGPCNEDKGATHADYRTPSQVDRLAALDTA